MIRIGKAIVDFRIDPGKDWIMLRKKDEIFFFSKNLPVVGIKNGDLYSIVTRIKRGESKSAKVYTVSSRIQNFPQRFFCT